MDIFQPTCHVIRTFNVTQHLISKKSNEEILADFYEFQNLMFVTNEYQYELTLDEIAQLFDLYNAQRLYNKIFKS